MKILIIRHKNLIAFLKTTEKHIQQIISGFPQASITLVEDQKEEINKEISNAEIIITVSMHNIDFKKAANLKWIHLTSAGADRMPEEIMNSDIIVTNSSGVHPIPITEHVFGFMLMLERKLHLLGRFQSKKEWARGRLQNVNELHGKTIGIVGLGRIGREIARLSKAFNMKVVAVVRNPREPEDYVDELLTQKEMARVLQVSDHVVVCLPLTKETHHLFDYEIFRKMKRSAYFINIGRGKVVNEKDLIRALKENLIAGAALDVFEEEPLPESSPLWEMENAIISPHYSGWTPHYMDRVTGIFCENLTAYLQNKKMPNMIDKTLGY